MAAWSHAAHIAAKRRGSGGMSGVYVGPGCHATANSLRRVSVTRWTLRSVRETVKMSRSSKTNWFAPREYATSVPSGENAGVCSTRRAVSVSLVTSEPSASTTKMSL